VDKFKQCRDVNDFDQRFHFEQFKEEHSDLESIKFHLERLQRWDLNITRFIKPQDSKGLIWVQGRKLKERLSTRVKAEQVRMKEYLHELAEQKVRES
jgi:superfamily II DNA helicase RecQ